MSLGAKGEGDLIRLTRLEEEAEYSEPPLRVGLNGKHRQPRAKGRVIPDCTEFPAGVQALACCGQSGVS